MNGYLLDTNVISELRKKKPHGAVIAWFSALQENQIYLSAVTLGELQAGIELVRPQNPEKARELEVWVDTLEITLPILPVDSTCFREVARIMPHKSIQLIQDAMIAATARVHNLTVATRDEADFKQFAVTIVNPFKS